MDKQPKPPTYCTCEHVQKVTVRDEEWRCGVCRKEMPGFFFEPETTVKNRKSHK